MEVLRQASTKFDEAFTSFALRVDNVMHRRSLMDVPSKPWTVFLVCICVHPICATAAAIMSVTCFYLGSQYSYMYLNVNCGNGMATWVAIANVLTAFTGINARMDLLAVWKAFLHFLFVCLVTVYNICAVVDASVSIGQWTWWAAHPRATPNWPQVFIWIDSVIIVLLSLNLLICIVMLVIHIVYHRNWFDLSSSWLWWQRPQRTPVLSAASSETPIVAAVLVPPEEPTAP